MAAPRSTLRRPAPGRAPARLLAALAAGLSLCGGCATERAGLLRTLPAARRAAPRTYTVEATAYCPCGRCCNWRRAGFGRAVVASGPRRGQPKRVGRTAGGTRARPGTIAADTGVFPFGTVLYVPGYGYGRVEDRGGAIRGLRIDVFFRTHAAAVAWGRRRLEVRAWLP